MPKFDSDNIMIKLQMIKNQIIMIKKLPFKSKKKLTRKSVYNNMQKNKLPLMKRNLLLVMII